MEPYEHRRSRPLHRFRYGVGHYRQHRGGVKHGHRRRSWRRRERKPVLDARSLVHRSRRLVRSRWPAEIAKQFCMGACLAVALVFVVCAVLGVITIIKARDDLRGAEGEATALAQDRSQLFTSSGRAHAGEQIDAMQRGADRASNLVDGSVPLEVLSWIPFVGQQVTGVTQLVGDVDTTSHQAGTLLESVDQLVAASHGTTISLPALSILQANVTHAVGALRPLDRGSGLLIGPLATARTNFDTEITKITDLLVSGEHLLTYAGPFLGADGPRTYFLAGENNAEMRDQGSVLSWALLTANDGTFSMTSAQSVGTLSIRRPAPVALPPGTQTAFGVLQPTRVWQSTNATASFPLTGKIIAAMYHQRTGRTVDGVIGVDVPALMHILDVTGPVKVKSIPLPVTAKNIEYVLLHGLYLLYPKGYEQGTRHDEIAAVAKAAVDKMKHHRYDLAYLVDQLAKATNGRHLLLWSASPTLEAEVTRFGASGSLVAQGTSAIHLAIESAVAAKLDWYVHTDVTYTVLVDRNGAATIQAKVVVINTAPRTGVPHYIVGGPEHPNQHYAGQYVGRLDLWFPRGAVTPGGLPESGLTLARTIVNVLPGHKETYVLDALVPHAVVNGRYTLRFIPQSGLFPQLSKVIFTATGRTVRAGPTVTIWEASSTRTLTWTLSS